MNVDEVRSSLNDWTLYSQKCSECKKIKTAISGTDAILDPHIFYDLILHCAEHSLEHDDQKRAEKYVDLCFDSIPQSVLYLGRANVVGAKLNSAVRYDKPEFEKAMQYFSNNLQLTQDSTLSREEKLFLIKTTCSAFWEVGRTFMQFGNQKYIHSIIKECCKKAFEYEILDKRWNILWALEYLASCSDENNQEIDEIWRMQDVWNPLESLPVNSLCLILWKLSQMNMEDKLYGSKYLSNPMWNLFFKMWQFKKKPKEEASEDEFNELLYAVMPSELSRERSATKSNVSIHINKVNLIDYNMYKEFFYICLDVNRIDIAKKCLQTMAKLQVEQNPLEKNLLKLILKEFAARNEYIVISDVAKKRHAEMVAIAKSYRALEKLIESGSPNNIQQGCSLLWNLCLKFLDRTTRIQIYPSFLLINSGLELIKSNCTTLLYQLHTELTKCEIIRGDYLKVEKHLNKAISMDAKDNFEILLDIRKLHFAITKNKNLTRVLECKEQVIYDLYELLIIRPKDTATCKSVLIHAANAMSDDIFIKILYTEQWPWDIANEKKWFKWMQQGQEEILYLTKMLSKQEDKMNFLLWARITRFAVEYELWDIVRVAARFCLVTNAATCHYTDVESETSKVSNHLLPNNELRVTALIYLYLTQAIIVKLDFLEITFLDSIDQIVKSLDVYLCQTPTTLRTNICLDLVSKSSTVATNIEYAVEAGIKLNEPWLVIYALRQYWNIIFELEEHDKYSTLIDSIVSYQKLLLSYGSKGDLQLLLYYTNCTLKSTIPDIIQITYPNTNTIKVEIKLVSPAVEILATNVLKTCQSVLKILCSNFEDINIMAAWVDFNYLIQCWLRITQVLSKPLDEKIYQHMENEDKIMVRFLISQEQLTIMNYTNYLAGCEEEGEEHEIENEKSFSLLDTINTAREIKWNCDEIEFHVWTNLAQLAYDDPPYSLFQTCYEKVVNLGTKVNESYKKMCIVMCMKADILINDLTANFEAVDILMQSLRKCCSKNDDELFEMIITHAWNICFPIISDIFLRQSYITQLAEITEICIEYLRNKQKTKGKMQEKVTPNILELICYFVNGSIQTMMENKQYESAIYLLSKFTPMMTSFKHNSDIAKHLRFHYQILESNANQTITEKFEQYSSEKWLEFACCSSEFPVKLEAFCNAINQLGSNILEATHIMLIHSEFLWENQYPDVSNAQAIAILTYERALTKSLQNDFTETENPIYTHICMACILVYMVRFYNRGSTEYTALIIECCNSVINVWKDIESKSEEIQDLKIFQNFEQFASYDIHSHVSNEVFGDEERSTLQQMKKMIVKCLVHLSDELYWLGYYQFILPDLALVKVILSVTDSIDDIFIIDLKLLNICIKLNLKSRANDLHLIIFKPFLSKENLLKFECINQSMLRDREIERLLNYTETTNSNLVSENLDAIKMELEAAHILQSMGYLGLVDLFIIKLFNSEVKENKNLLIKCILLLADHKLLVNDLTGAKKLLICCQNSCMEDDSDFLKLSLLHYDIILAMKNEDWAREAEFILQETGAYFQTFSTKFPRHTAHYNQLQLKIQLKLIELYLMSEINSECESTIESVLNSCLDYIEQKWLKNGLEIFIEVATLLINSPPIKSSGYGHPICDKVIRTINEAIICIDQEVKDINLSIHFFEPSIQLFKTEIIQLKLLLAQLTILSAKSRIEDIENFQTGCEPQQLIGENYVASLPPWNWEEDQLDYTLILNTVLSSMSILQSTVKKDTLEEIKTLHIAGTSLLLSVKYLAAVHYCTLAESNKLKSTDDPHNIPQSHHALQTEDLNCVCKNLKVQASSCFFSAFIKANQLYPEIAAEAAIALVDCCLLNNPLSAIKFLLVYQALDMTITIKNLLFELFPNPNALMMTTLLNQQNNLTRNGLQSSPLYWSNDKLLRKFEVSKFFKIIEETNFKSRLPFNIDVVIILQHSKNRETLYGGFYCSNDSVITKIKCRASDFDQMTTKLDNIQQIWCDLMNRNKISEVIMSEHFTTLLQKYKQLIKDIEKYLEPIIKLFPKSLFRMASSETTSERIPQPTTILLLADISLQKFPLESLPFFQINFLSCSVVRDFSFDMYCFKNETTKTATSTQIKMNKAYYMIEDNSNGYPGNLYENIKSFLLDDLRIDRKNIIVGNSKSFETVNWGQSDVLKNLIAWICVTSPESCRNLIKDQIMNNRPADLKLALIFSFSDQPTIKNSLEYNPVNMALLLSLAGFSTIVINQWIGNKFSTNDIMYANLKEIRNNLQGVSYAVNIVNGITKRNEPVESFETTSSTTASAKSSVYEDVEDTFFTKFLTSNLVCYGLNNVALLN